MYIYLYDFFPRKIYICMIAFFHNLYTLCTFKYTLIKYHIVSSNIYNIKVKTKQSGGHRN